jgi:hypothetical protein
VAGFVQARFMSIVRAVCTTLALSGAIVPAFAWPVNVLDGRGYLSERAASLLRPTLRHWPVPSSRLMARQQTNVCNLIAALKGHGLFTKLDRMWLYACENATQASIAIVNLATH